LDFGRAAVGLRALVLGKDARLVFGGNGHEKNLRELYVALNEFCRLE